MAVKIGKRVVPEPLRPTAHRIAELATLPADWDSYGAARISPRAMDEALAFVVNYMTEDRPVPDAVPTCHGGVQLEWHRNGVDLEVEFEPDGSVSWGAWDCETGAEVDEPLVGNEDTLRRWLKRAAG